MSNQLLTVTYRERTKGKWGAFIHTMRTVEEAASNLVSSKGKTFETTKPGDRVVTRVSGTLTELAEVADIVHPVGACLAQCYHCWNEKQVTS